MQSGRIGQIYVIFSYGQLACLCVRCETEAFTWYLPLRVRFIRTSVSDQASQSNIPSTKASCHHIGICCLATNCQALPFYPPMHLKHRTSSSHALIPEPVPPGNRFFTGPRGHCLHLTSSRP